MVVPISSNNNSRYLYVVACSVQYGVRYHGVMSAVYISLAVYANGVDALLVKVNSCGILPLATLRLQLYAAHGVILNEIFIFLYHFDEWRTAVVRKRPFSCI